MCLPDCRRCQRELSGINRKPQFNKKRMAESGLPETTEELTGTLFKTLSHLKPTISSDSLSRRLSQSVP